MHTNQVILGKKHHDSREVASLTKIMTCYVTLMLCKKLGIPMGEFTIRVSKLAAGMTGTSAELNEGEHLKVLDLLYALMLPSGNDAAWALAESLGCLLYYEFNNRSRMYEIVSSRFLSVGNETAVQEPVRHFINEMNRVAQELKLYNTSFANPHGLMNRFNKSTASDIAKLSCTAIKNPQFIQIVNARSHECVIKNSRLNTNRKEIWFNTNKLLEKGFLGVKTGVTDTAGPCLVASMRLGNTGKDSKKEPWCLCVILGCRSMEKRWGECEDLLNWAMKEVNERALKQ